MSERRKFFSEEKIQMVKEYLSGKAFCRNLSNDFWKVLFSFAYIDNRGSAGCRTHGNGYKPGTTLPCKLK